jgi:tetratricopeptide (TPR) repeat protein
MPPVADKLQLGLEHHQAGRLAQAEHAYRDVLTCDPRQADALHLLGVIAHQQGDHESAIELIGQAVALNPSSAAFHSNLGEAQRALRQLPEAEASFRDALRLMPAWALVHNNLGTVLREQGKLKQAEAAHREALRLHPAYAQAHNNLGMLLKEQGKLDAALHEYQEALRLEPTLHEAHNKLGNVHATLGKRDEAAVCFRAALRLRPDYADAQNNLGNVLRDQGKRDEARACFDEAVRLQPNHVEAHINLALLLRGDGKIEEALERCRQALKVEKRRQPQTYHLQGLLLRARGRLDEAADSFEDALRQSPAYFEALANFAGVRLEQSKPEQALGVCRRAVEDNPDWAEAHGILANVLRAMSEHTDALASYDEALRLKPDWAGAHLNRGALLAEQGKLDEALVCYEKALRLQPNLVDAHISKANLFIEQNRLDEAVASLDKASECSPDDGLKIRSALVLPIISASVEQGQHYRRRLMDEVARLRARPLHVAEPTLHNSMTAFYLAYQGKNDRDVQAAIADLFIHANPALMWSAPHCQPNGARSRRKAIRVGFVSCFFNNHTIGRLNLGIVRELTRPDFHATLFRFPGRIDHVAQMYNDAADKVVTLTPNLDRARHEIADEDLDVLFYTDIGMEPVTYFLAFARLAPVQCVTWGHPVTTGIRNLDYFISSIQLEPNDADEH